MKAIFFRFSAVLFFALSCSLSEVRAQALPKCTVAAVAPDDEGNMTFSIQGDQHFYMGNARFVLHIGKAVFTLNQQDSSVLTFFIPMAAFNQLAEGEQMFLQYGEAHSGEDEELLADACRQRLVNVRSLGLFTRDLLRR